MTWNTKLFMSAAVLALAPAMAVGGAASGQDAPIVQPGAPGEAGRQLSGEEAARIADNRYSDDDVSFMQGMILHHAQALEMARMVPARTSDPTLRTLARRIDVSQESEIELMSRWLESRGEDVPEVHLHDWDEHPEGYDHGGAGGDQDAHADHAHHGGHGGHGDHVGMQGMLSPEQMAELASLEGTEFERLFLESMIVHHEGAIVMVTELFRSPGAAQDSDIYGFAGHVESDQVAEIGRMEELLQSIDR